MGYMELIEALRKEGEEKMRAIWREAEAEAEKIRRDAAVKIGEMKEKHGRVQASTAKDKSDDILSDAAKRARSIRLLSEEELSDRLYRLSVPLLRTLRGKDYKDVFSAIVKELPQNRWEVIRVNPEDEDIAKGYFPDSEIVRDINITGGLEASAAGGGIRILNTFEKRLERVWNELLPEIIRDARCSMDGAEQEIG